LQTRAQARGKAPSLAEAQHAITAANAHVVSTLVAQNPDDPAALESFSIVLRSFRLWDSVLEILEDKVGRYKRGEPTDFVKDDLFKVDKVTRGAVSLFAAVVQGRNEVQAARERTSLLSELAARVGDDEQPSLSAPDSLERT